MSAADAEMKLVRVLGEQRARALLAQLLPQLGLTDIESADARYLLSTALIKEGGVLEAVGRSIRIQSLLQGAAAGIE
jgi:hypothetical protein